MEHKINDFPKRAEPPVFFEEELAKLLQNDGEDISDFDKQNIIFWFAKNGLSVGIRSVSLLGWEAKEVAAAGMAQLAWAARGGDADCILLSAEAPGLHGRDQWGANALHHWAEAKGGEISAGGHVLLGLGLDPVARDQWGMLPMHWGRDEGVWAWGMAAAWAKGDPEAWRTCGEHASADVMGLVHRGRMQAWAEKVGMGGHPRSLARRARREGRPFTPGEREAVEAGLAGRAAEIEKISEVQNCIARSLGIELLARQFQFIE